MSRSSEVDVNTRIPGSLYAVPDKFWGFRAVGRRDHPGACLFCYADRNAALLSKGTDSRGGVAKNLDQPYHVLPSEKNGLNKPITFDLVPKRFRLKRVLLMEPDRKMGDLESADLKAMQNEYRRIFMRDDAQGRQEQA